MGEKSLDISAVYCIIVLVGTTIYKVYGEGWADVHILPSEFTPAMAAIISLRQHIFDEHRRKPKEWGTHVRVKYTLPEVEKVFNQYHLLRQGRMEKKAEALRRYIKRVSQVDLATLN